MQGGPMVWGPDANSAWTLPTSSPSGLLISWLLLHCFRSQNRQCRDYNSQTESPFNSNCINNTAVPASLLSGIKSSQCYSTRFPGTQIILCRDFSKTLRGIHSTKEL
ncbi:hypothetical protein XELAEV_18044350mg [Xenopus laevis]|uniref:Uncharacterized protein n=1 Tax=Xenopus laevis TaxID=8355 RepID=A0A974BYT8_XENLA|nr:hypothetical protein XELAEV_18044350mg [Xenopus laevis]